MGVAMINHTHMWLLVNAHPGTWRPHTKFQPDWSSNLAVKITHAYTHTELLFMSRCVCIVCVCIVCVCVCVYILYICVCVHVCILYMCYCICVLYICCCFCNCVYSSIVVGLFLPPGTLPVAKKLCSDHCMASKLLLVCPGQLINKLESDMTDSGYTFSKKECDIGTENSSVCLTNLLSSTIYNEDEKSESKFFFVFCFLFKVFIIIIIFTNGPIAAWYWCSGINS